MEEDFEKDQNFLKMPLVHQVGLPDRFSVVAKQVRKDFPVLSLEFIRHIPNRFNSLFRPPLGFDVVEFSEGVHPRFGHACSFWGVSFKGQVEFGRLCLQIGGNVEGVFVSGSRILRGRGLVSRLVVGGGVRSVVLTCGVAKELEDVGIAPYSQSRSLSSLPRRSC